MGEDEDDASTDMDDTRGFDVEYEIGSEEDDERPPQAHGQGKEFSSADDTDSDIDELHRVISTVAVAKESVYWADSEEEKGETEEVNLVAGKDGIWKCISCQTPNNPFIRYCSPCWE